MSDQKLGTSLIDSLFRILEFSVARNSNFLIINDGIGLSGTPGISLKMG